MIEREKYLLDLFGQTPPRTVPAKIAKAAISPLANFFILMGILMLILSIIAIYPMLMRGKISFFSWIEPGGLMLSATIMVLIGVVRHRNTKEILSNGIVVKGLVRVVSHLPAHINGRTFCTVKVEVPHPGGATVIAKDTVDNFTFDYFLDAQDHQTEIDVLYYPKFPHRVLLLKKIELTRRFD